MSPELQSLLVYWPTGAYAAALVAVVFAAGWFSTSMKRFMANLAAAGKNRKDLDAARAASKDHAGKVKARRVEMEKLNEDAAKLFWQKEKTWVG